MGKLRTYQIVIPKTVSPDVAGKYPSKMGIEMAQQATFDSQRVFQKHPETIYVWNT